MPLAIRKPTDGNVASDDGPRAMTTPDAAEALPVAPALPVSAAPSPVAASRFALPAAWRSAVRLPRSRAEWAGLAPTLLAAAGIVLGVVVRAIHALPKGFPSNDGGLFFAMVRDLQANGYRLPEFTSYNSGSIPFAYAPFGFYLAGLLNDVTRIPLMTLFLWIPFLASAATVPAFYVLARAMLPSRTTAIIALFVFALIPRSFIWMIMGGGLTRSLGFLFAIIALHRVYRLYITGNAKYILPTVIYSALSVLSHLETGQFLAYSILVFLFFYGANRRALWHSAAIAASVAAITAPWWGMVLSYHGLGPFQEAHKTGISIFAGEAERDYILNTLKNLASTTSEPFFPLFYRLAILGGITTVLSALFTISRRGVLLPGLPVWWLAIILLDNRASSTYTTVAMAMLAGVAVTDFILPLLNVPLTSKPYSWQVALFSLQRERPAHLQPESPLPPQAQPRSVSTASRPVLVALVAVIVGYGTLSTLQTGETFTYPWYSIADRGFVQRTEPVESELRSLTALTPADIAAMDWVHDMSPAEAQFLVISQRMDWTTDKTSEWFPVLAGRPSVVTAQGYEWLPDRVFISRIQQHWAAQACVDQDANCIENWAASTGHTFEYVYVRLVNPEPTMCCTLVPSLLNDPRYQLVYTGPGAAIFARATNADQPR